MAMKRLLLRIYAFVFLNDFVLIYPLYAVMFTDHGLSAAQVAAIMAVWSGAVFVLEIPSGVLADKFSRRTIMFVGQMARALGYVAWLFFPGFWGYLTGFLLWGVKSALTHGTFEAYLYDELKALNAQEEYVRVMSRVRALAFLAILAASAGASAAILLGYGFVLVLSIIGVVMAGVVALTLPSAPRSRTEDDSPSLQYFELLGLGLKNATRDPIVLRIMLFMAFVTGIVGTLDEFWPIFADMSGAAQWGIPLFVGVLSGVQGLAALFAHRLEGWSDHAFYLCVIISGSLLIVAALNMALWTLGLLIVISALDAVVKVIFDARLQHRIGSNTRATVSSVKGLLIELLGLGGLGIFGLVSVWHGAQTSFAVMGAIIAAVGAAYLLLFRRARR